MAILQTKLCRLRLDKTLSEKDDYFRNELYYKATQKNLHNIKYCTSRSFYA